MNKKKCFIIASPLIVITIMCIFYALHDIFPFGSKTVAWCDLKQQTIPLLLDFKDVLDGKSSIFYSPSSGGGINFWGVFLFFLASPFYLAVKFIAKQDIVYFVNIVLILKLALCALTSSLYLCLRFKRLDKKYIVFLSLVYAFSGYGLMYYQTLVWLDIMYLFPLLVLSVDNLCIGKKAVFFTIMVSICMIVSYYLSFMLVIYLLISIPIFMAIRCRKCDRKEVAAKFLFSLVCAALITAPVWLCSLIQVGKSARSMNNLLKLMYGNMFESFKDKMCIILSDAFIFSALIFIEANNLFRRSRIRYNFILLLFLIIPVFADPVNKMWHGGGYQSFPLRYGYMISFTIIVIAADIIEKFPESRGTFRTSTLAFALAALFCTICAYSVMKHKKELSAYVDSLWITNKLFLIILCTFLLAFLIYFVYIVMLRKGLISKNIFFALICCIFMSETFVNLSVYVGFAASYDQVFKRTVSLENRINEDRYYRVKSEKKYVHANMIGALGLNSYAHYTSLTPQNYMFAMKKLGYSSYWMEVSPNGGTIMTDALLGIKYTIGTDSDFKSYQKKLDSEPLMCVAENMICAPAGIVSSLSPEDSGELMLTDRFGIQRQLAERFFGTDNMLEKYEIASVTDGNYEYSDGKFNITGSEPDISRCRIRYNLKIKGHKTLYFDLFDELGNRVSEPIYNSVMVSVNGSTVSECYPNSLNNGFLELGEFENEGAEITVTFLKNVSVRSFGVFGVDSDKLRNAIKNLKTAEPELNGNEISVSCSARKDQFLYLAVPWDSGFTAYLNGTKTNLYKVNDSFCALELSEGKNFIRLVFYPEGFRISLAIMAVGVILFTVGCIFKRIFSAPKIGSISYILSASGFVAVLLLIYIIPVIIYFAGLILRSGV